MQSLYRTDLERIVQQFTKEGKACPLLAAWDKLAEKIDRLSPDHLAGISEDGLEGPGEGNCTFRGLEIAGGRITVEADVTGNVSVAPRWLSDDLRESVEKLISLLPETTPSAI